MKFQVISLLMKEVADLLVLPEVEMQRRGIKRLRVDSKPGYPCRLSLKDAEIGEEVILFSYQHLQANSPYQSSGPVYVRTLGQEASLPPNELPEMLEHRLLSVRVYDADAMMIDARTLGGKNLPEAIDEIFARPRAAYIHVHNAGPGCYNCEIRRA